MDGDREMNLRYASTCVRCGVSLPRGSRAIYNTVVRNVRHVDCDTTSGRGAAGASARREHARRSAKDAARVAKRKSEVQDFFGGGVLGRVASSLLVDDRARRSTEVWVQGAVGEEHVAGHLDRLEQLGCRVFHDRRIPGSKANIDHICITPWGVWVIDAKRYRDRRPDVVIEGGVFGIGGTARLTVGGRREDKLVEQALSQAAEVRAVVGDGVPVSAALAFVDADWPLIGGDFTIRGVAVVWPRRLRSLMIRKDPPVVDVDAVAGAIARSFPSA